MSLIAKKIIASIVILLCCVSVGIAYIKESSLFLSPTYSHSRSEVTLHVKDLVVTENQIATLMSVTMDSGEDFKYSPEATSHTYKFHDSEGKFSSYAIHSYGFTDELLYSNLHQYQPTGETPYMTYTIPDITTRNYCDEIEITYRGPWEVCIPLEPTHPSIQLTIGEEVLLGENPVIVESVNIDALSVQVNISKLNLEDRLDPPKFKEAEVKYKDGSTLPLQIRMDYYHRLHRSKGVENYELVYVHQESADQSAPQYEETGYIPIIDVKNIENFTINGTDILN